MTHLVKKVNIDIPVPTRLGRGFKMQEATDRQKKGVDIVLKEDITQISASVFVAKGSKPNKTYRIIAYGATPRHPDGFWTCECWDFKARGRKTGEPCKHITAAKVYQTLHGKWSNV